MITPARMFVLTLSSLLGAATAMWFVPGIVGIDRPAAAEGQPANQTQVEQFIQNAVTSQGGGKVIVDPVRYPSPIPGLEEVRFVIESTGVRRPGVVYIAGDKLVLGHVIDLPTQRNLTTQGMGRGDKITYSLDQFDLKGRVPRGDDSAALTIIEFADFQCPYCKTLHETIQALMQQYPGKVRLYYKHFPLDNHPLAYPMAMASECARAQKPDAFWALHDDFFHNQYTGMDRDLLMERLREWAKERTLNADRLITCVDDREFADRIDIDRKEAASLGITGTPAMIANGEYLGGAVPIGALEKFLQPPAKN